MTTYTFTKHITLTIDWCGIKGHTWRLDKTANCWRCKSCHNELYVHQVDSYHHRPTRKQRQYNTYGNYYYDPDPAPEWKNAPIR